uniref:Uncharacterized protein n=1 Tax=Heterorhabditis bacteriophora TaxID=37862 RepID=A0A1I7WI63_HETBA
MLKKTCIHWTSLQNIRQCILLCFLT